jgi:2'-hydroxyisoflavone reductase
MVVPGKPADPIQIIDVRDLADWIILCLENKTAGVYNATGPEKELSMKGMVEGVCKGVGTTPSLIWIENTFLEAGGVTDGQFPLYAAPTGETAGFHRCNISRALAKGLKFRPVPDTAKATLDWYKSLPPEIQARVAPQFAATGKDKPWLETEKTLLEAWNKREKKEA